MMNKTMLCLVAMLFISSVFADVHKWKDVEGKTHYGDAPPVAGTSTVKTDKQTDDEIANGERIRADTENSSSQGTASDPKCAELLEQLSNARIDPSAYYPDTLVGRHDRKMAIENNKIQRSAITQEYELRCMSSADRQDSAQKRANAQKQQQTLSGGSGGSGKGSTTMCPNGSYVSSGPCTLCPDGSYVGGGERCVMTPNGGYVGGGRSGNESPRMTPDGSYVSGGGRTIMCPDGSYVSGSRCEMTPNGGYVGK